MEGVLLGPMGHCRTRLFGTSGGGGRNAGRACQLDCLLFGLFHGEDSQPSRMKPRCHAA